MRKRTFLGFILLLSLVLSLSLPLYEVFFTLPAYERLLLKDVEQEAVRHVGVMLHSLSLDQQPLTSQRLPPLIDHEIERLQQHSPWVKVRFFSPQGEIIYSTAREETGMVNQKDYFVEVIRQGNLYSKVVNKDQVTAEGVPSPVAVAEIYVPVMFEGNFGGAVEIYVDISQRAERLRTLHHRSLLLQLALGFGLLGVIFATLSKVREALLKREMAEAALKRANHELEDRVCERTVQLEESCRKLKEEVVERIVVQDLLSETLGVLQGEKDRIQGILRSVGDGLMVIDESDRVTMMNPAAESLLGCRFCVVGGGVPLESLVFNPALLDYLNLVLRRAPGYGIEDFELSGLASRKVSVLRVRTSQLIGAESRVIGKILLIQDVTEERSYESMKRQFISMATHELQTPLASMIGYAELLTGECAERFTAQERQGFCTKIYEKGFALSRIVDDLVDACQVDSGQVLSIEKNLFSFSDRVQRAVNNFYFDSERHQMVVDCSEESLVVDGDGGRIEQVLGNLLSNAIKYSPQGGEIKVSVTGSDGFAKVRVADQGIGIPADQISRVFDRFYRVDTSSTAAGGIGLGLSIARYIVEAHGGQIWVESEARQGTAVSFTLPLAATKLADLSLAVG